MKELNLNDCQRIQTQWEEMRYQDKRSIPDRFFRMEEEWVELEEAVEVLVQDNSVENRRKVAEEAIDVLIQTLQIIDATGFSADVLFNEKVEKMFTKYPPTTK